MKGSTVVEFKACLDKFPESVPDEPHISILTPKAISQVTGRASNSVIDQIRKITTQGGG